MINADKLAAKLFQGEYLNDVAPEVWIRTFELIDAKQRLLDFNSEAVHTLWVVNGGARSKLKCNTAMKSTG